MPDAMPRSATSRPAGTALPPGEPAPTGADGASKTPLIVPLAALGRDDLALAGGKGLNLGILLRAGLPVPAGFCVTTAAYAVVAAAPAVVAAVDALAAASPDDADDLAALVRAALLAAPVPDQVEAGIRAAYRALGADVPVAVRSSATAEDLPTASFAGQQDTELNVVGEEAVVAAVRRCWASLWTDRAVSYRARNAINQWTVRLAVVVQRMVAAQAAGVLFTADPVTGRRDRAVVDASPGLGEAIVSGAVNPDHWVLDARSGRALEERLGDKRVAVRAMAGGGTERIALADDGQPCLTADQLATLAGLGRRAQALFGAPQDIEFAVDEAGAIWLTQARPITTLYPLPTSAPPSTDEARAYFSINVAQGVFRPFTPMGAQALRMTGSSVMRALGHPPRDPVAGPSLVVEAGSRLFIDVTSLVRHPIGRRAFLGVTRLMEARTHAIVRGLADDPRFAPRPGSPWPAVRLVAGALARTRAPLRAARALLDPAWARASAARTAAEVRALGRAPDGADAAARLDAVARLLLDGPGRIAPSILPLAAAGLLARAAAGRLLGDLAAPGDIERVFRALPHNPTTEMDLGLWSLAVRVRTDAASAEALRSATPAELAGRYRAGTLPDVLQRELGGFLARYGHRGVAEIDLGLPNWGEDPTHILGVLANYLRVDDPARSPDVQFARAAREAEDAVAELTAQASRHDHLRGALVGFLLGRSRELAGLREVPKAEVVRLYSRVRAELHHVGAELAAAGRLDGAADVFFLTLPEAHAALAGRDLRALVSERRAEYDRELRRRHIPRILLSDGSEPAPPAEALADPDVLTGTAASPGLVTGAARVILDPTGAHLEPGEILVAPSTDPGWTPLFLTAGGLVMEMGGAMSHGAVVAREYGIPAVVGVAGATERIRTGDTVTVDGTTGSIRLAGPDDRPDA